MPLSLPPPVAASLNELLLYVYRKGIVAGLEDACNSLTPGKGANPNLNKEPLHYSIPVCPHMEHFLLQLEQYLLTIHHHTPASPFLDRDYCSHKNTLQRPSGNHHCLDCNTVIPPCPPQASATFPPPLDSQDQL